MDIAKSIKNKVGKYYDKEDGSVSFAHSELTTGEYKYFIKSGFFFSEQLTTEKKNKVIVKKYHLAPRGVEFFTKSSCFLWIKANSNILHLVMTAIAIAISLIALLT